MVNYNNTKTGQLTRKASTPAIHELVLRHLAYVEGLENIPRTGPVILVANHASYMDHFVTKTLSESVRAGRVSFPTKSEAFESFLSRVWHESMDCYPVNRNAPGKEVFQRAHEALLRDDALVLYPEGTRNTGKGLLPFKTGAFRIALENKVPVVPIGLTGLAEVLPKGARLPRRHLLSVAIGKPLERASSGDTRSIARSMRDDAYDAIGTLKDRARHATPSDCGHALETIVELAQQIVSENLTPEGTLSAEVIHRVELLLKIADKTSQRRLDLRVQQARLDGFRAMNAPTATGAFIRTALVHRKASKLSDLHSSNDFAAYLAGRSALMLPQWFGGGAERARIHFQRATEREGNVASQAYVGLAESLAISGNTPAALQAYQHAASSIAETDPRGSVRKRKIKNAIAALTSAHEGEL
ncbi:1-acyl-sn-glycerol-3-phosphate acyltransferase [Corynebacterium sp. 320]|uniref:1-acyl-sn-glycerol-3-phosphate acyltransferase n=1 Tax=Corynebacterium TaxID=1716 RepID=UPI00125CCEE8|nr:MULTISPECIES: 1-acyl-sn-glycerol-3-phosphate acyltransferase [Corynebacterium]KAB1504402.1 1-acyl-sn-glycerol-3-phosphate acyltransferase [Corynebacterium sp. 320]KAB1552499.1 1-acyl-sn-glycerol-3-phosphate acyltransferase [Corynebacterium sp. 321]KAB1554286.1 1-acyl-sn-glycerol-3-phosphate acyltransferase [Corynebacterium sp. 319]KAB3528538.1 1-acyl-sn-glycerol-3-phosphate acyltransferase [Corynebacterium sp. 250]KAB3539970.1 1-acyl-sn-glycerol-3-phosphate acyltransferase [Corynebacterium 